MSDCGLYQCEGHYACQNEGSEECDWCHNYDLIGEPVSHEAMEDGDEI